ncbi:MAG: thiol peroxidase [Chlamydiales bacterium]|nr:thiol peroxidase [Chlamydiales bacterium]
MTTENMRKGVATFKGAPLTLLGKEIKVGEDAPEFKLTSNDMQDVSLEAFKGKTLVLSVVPSLDTEVCSIQSKRFNDEAKKLPSNIVVVGVSVDLPFAQARWVKEGHCTTIQMLSDYKERSFGRSYGVLIDELKLLARSIFIIGPDKKVHYVEYVKEVTNYPDYDKALKALL